jgi:PAS domain-containing protein
MASIYFRVLGFLFTLFMQAFAAHADEMPPQSGVIAMASEPVSVKTTPLKGKVTSRTANTGQPIYLNDEIEKLTGYPKSDFLENRLHFIDLIFDEVQWYSIDVLSLFSSPTNCYSSLFCYYYY